MPSQRFTNQQIVFALRKAANGATTDKVCLKMAVEAQLAMAV